MGPVTAIQIADVDGDGELDLDDVRGSVLGTPGMRQIWRMPAGVLQPGSSAGILIYENVWAAPFAAALRRGGGQLVASGRIPVESLLAAVDASEDQAGSPRS